VRVIVPVRLRAAAVTLAALLVVAVPADGQATTASKQPTTAPLLRVETGMHTTLIRRLVADPARKRLFTSSDDKTIRVWQMPEGRLLSVLRIPIDLGHEGRIFGLAVSPDGRTVAAGGWTGWDWDGSASVYLIDVASGDLVRRIGGFANAISALVWHPDGKHLIVGLQGSGGMQVVRAENGSAVVHDTQYRDKIMDIDLSDNGRIAVASLDGMVRLYGPDFRLLGRRAVPGGKLPSALRFSPDGTQLAVTFVDVPALAVIDARSLAPLHQAPMTGLSSLAGLTSLAWSADGQKLHAGGEHRGEGLTPLITWGDRGKGAPVVTPLSRNRINELQRLPGGQIVYATEDPGFGLFDAAGKVSSFRGPDVIDFSRAKGRLELSEDGAVVRHPAAAGTQVFAVLGAGDQDLKRDPGTPLRPPRLASNRIDLKDWQNGYKPTINGKAPRLDDYEMVRSHAFTPDGERVVLGTEWGLRLYDAEATLVWNVPLPAVAWSVAVTPNGRLAVAALSDGTLRWFRMDQGAEVFAYFPHGNGKDWIGWIPDGYYMSSVYGDNLVGWHLNRGKDLAPDFYRAVQFERVLYRPDVVVASFRAASATARRSLGALPADANFRIERLRDIAPPRIRLSVDEVGTRGDGERAVVRIDGERSKLDIADFTLFVNGVPVTPTKDRVLSKDERAKFSRTIPVDLESRNNTLRVEAFNGTSMGVSEIYVPLERDYPAAAGRGDLYVLAVGVNKFTSFPSAMHLGYAAADAEAIARSLNERAGSQYRKVHVQLINDGATEKPDRATVIRALDFLKRAGPTDTSIVFLASHGISDRAGNYYFVPRDADYDDIARVARGESARTLIGWSVFFDALRGTTGRRALIVDTCQARSIEGRFEAHSLLKRSAASSFPLLVASKGDEESQEYAIGKHGLFTYALLQAMAPESDANRDGVLSLSEMFGGAAPVVQKLHDRTAGPQTPQIVAPLELGNLPLMRFAK
jgi:WD40 repeat protein